MANENEKPESSSIPAWQRNSEPNDSATPEVQSTSDVAAEEPVASTTEKKEQNDESSLTVARRFLEDPEVQSAPRATKVSFLKSKDISEADIQTLLGPEEHADSSPSQTKKQDTDRAPIVTYPEFLADKKSPGKEPLITPGALTTTLQASALLAVTIYGASRFILSPMLERLTEARTDLHAITATKLDDVIEKLEATVSQVPPMMRMKDEKEEEEDEDPAEMFHRDQGTQTSPPPPPIPSAASAPKDPAYVTQSTRIASLTRSLEEIRDGIRGQSDDMGDVKTLVDVFRDDLDALTYKSGMDYTTYGPGGYGKKNEPEDEIKKAKDNIRKVKGVLLSTRSFPTTVR